MEEILIIRYLQHSLSEEESLQFKLWLKSSPENRKLFNELKKAWSLNVTTDPLSDVDAEREFKKFKYRYFVSAGSGKQRSFNSRYLVFLKYAAVFVLSFMLAFYFFKVQNMGRSEFKTSLNEIKTKSGESSQITLADGSKIWINSCTSLKYPVNLTSKHVDIYLDGEAYFDLKKIPNRNITVHTSRININVLGTAFNLRSYSDDNIIETTLVRGKITISHSSEKDSKDKVIFLSPNQTAVYFKNTNSLEIPALSERRIQSSETQEGLEQLAMKSQSNLIIEESIDPKPKTSWIEGKFIFRKETFEKLIKRLERKYNVKITITDEKLKKARFSGTFDKESIEQALKALSYPVPFNYGIVKDSVTIQPK